MLADLALGHTNSLETAGTPFFKAMKNSQVMGAETVWGSLKMAKRPIFCTSILEKPYNW